MLEHGENRTNDFWNAPLRKIHIWFHIWNQNFIYEMKNFICEIGISHVKSKFHIWIIEFHIWNLTIHMWKFICKTESHMNFLIHIWNSYMWKQITYEIYMWKHITYEILNSYMKFYMWKQITYEIYMWKQITYEILYVKKNHIWNPRFIYEILYVKINHILNLRFTYEYQCVNKSYLKS